MDIGSGTKDILLYDDEKNIENCIKIVVPSPSSIYARKVIETTKLRKNLLIYGDVIGGGKFTSALLSHIKNGLSVTMDEYSAYSVRNDLEQVKEFGIRIIKTNNLPKVFDGKEIELDEIDLKKLKEFLINYDEDLSDIDAIGIAVQDHGAAPVGMSNRKFRIRKMKELLSKRNDIFDLTFIENTIPRNFIRMNSAFKASKRILTEKRVIIMDTSFAAILGCLCDPIIKKTDPFLAINFGNDHTLAFIISGTEVCGMMEHHTKLLNPEKIRNLIDRFVSSKIDDSDIFNDGGHGAFYLSPLKKFEIELIAATGPNRNLIKKTGLKYHFATPGGDMMMTGPLGLAMAAKEKI
jgi:uncharacterized protein (DUF1786 family)